MIEADQFLSPVVRDLVPYVPGEQPKWGSSTEWVKLNTNESPYPPSPRVVAAIQAAAQQGLALYPDPQALALRQTVAEYHGLQVDQVFAGNGSDEVLAHAFFAFFQQGSPLLMPDISYGFYKVYCALYSIPVELVALDDQMCLDVRSYDRSPQCPVAGVVVANPNAPTGIGLPLSDIERLLQLHPQRVVLVDEAYVDFGGASAIGLIGQYPNLLVVQTLSKSRSLAGLRVGFACGQAHLIAALERVKNSFNSYPLDRLAIAGAVAAFEDEVYFRKCCAQVIHTREGLTLQLEDLGFEVLPSQANFVFARHPSVDAATLASGLREAGILVRHFNMPRIDLYLRITVGTPGQCDALLRALERLVSTPTVSTSSG